MSSLVHGENHPIFIWFLHKWSGWYVGRTFQVVFCPSNLWKYTFSWCPHLMKLFQISHLLDFWHFCIIVLVPIVLCTNGTCSVFCPSVWLVLFPAVSSTWEYVISVALSSKKHWPNLCTCLLPSAPQCKSCSQRSWSELSIKRLGHAAETSVLLAQTSSLAEVSPAPDKSALSTFLSARN